MRRPSRAGSCPRRYYEKLDAFSGQTVTRETLVRYTLKSIVVNGLIDAPLCKRILRFLGRGLAGGGQLPHQFLLLLQQIPQFWGRRIGLNAALHVGQLFFGLAMAQGVHTTLGLLPG